MAVQPKIPKINVFLKKCDKCGERLPSTSFAPTLSFFSPDGLCNVCNNCITSYLRAENFGWSAIDKICQLTDIPFLPKEWERLLEQSTPDTIWETYAKVFSSQEYQNLGWADYNNQFRKLKEKGGIEQELPLLQEEKIRKLQLKWGYNYDEESLFYLEDLFKGLLTTQNVNGALQVDQAKKICKISLEIDNRIRAGDKDVDKFLSSYDKIVKTAEFTPKNIKNATDFDSIGELALWLEKRGYVNKFYDGTTRDVIDETIKNIQNWNQRLYVNEGGIGEEIAQRLQSLQTVQEMENYYDVGSEENLDYYDNEGYTKFEDDKFDPGGEF